MPINGDIGNDLAAYRAAVRKYSKFRERAEVTEIPEATKQAENVLSILDGDDVLLKVTTELGIDLPRLIARSAIWVDPYVFHALRKQIVHGTWFPNCRRGKNGEPTRGVVDGVRFDEAVNVNSSEILTGMIEHFDLEEPDVSGNFFNTVSNIL